MNSSFGGIHVNFDAETAKEALALEEYEKIYKLELPWSETFQAASLQQEKIGLFTGYGSLQQQYSMREQGTKLHSIYALLKAYGKRFSANLVIGNAAYGLQPSYSQLAAAGGKLARQLPKHAKAMKLGAEGASNGRKAIDLAARTAATAYVLHTPATPKLLEYARDSKVKYVLYTLVRLSTSTGAAAYELQHLKGTAYFERRGVLRDNISSCLDDFAVFGTEERVGERVRSFLDAGGASRVVLYPVFQGYKDLLSQLKRLQGCFRS